MGYDTPQSKKTVKKRLYSLYTQNVSHRFEQRRRARIMDLISQLPKPADRPLSIVEVGCGVGKDFLRHFGSDSEYDLYGVDMRDLPGREENFTFIQADAEDIPCDDNQFDVAVSIGVLEHVSPVAKLDRVTAEIDRIGKHSIIIVPSNATWFEPHTMQFNWQKRAMDKKAFHDHLFYYSDEAWLQMAGFKEHHCKHFNYIPGLVNNLFITNIQ